MSDRPSSFLGIGWSFPPSFTAGGAEIELVSDFDDVHQSLAILIATRKGERTMQESYGCSLDYLMFEEVDHGLYAQIASVVSDAILDHEPRVRLQDVNVKPTNESGILHIEVDYSIIGTNSRFNLVFPFSLNEALIPGF